jgi:hypothetical protein
MPQEPYGARLALASLLLCGATIAVAAEPETQPVDVAASQSAPGQEPKPPESETTAAQPASTKEKWEFATIGYVWFAGAWGKTDLTGPTPPVDLKLPFGKVLKAFKFAFMGAAEARHGRFVALGDLTFIHLDARQGIGIRDPNFLKVELDSRTAEVTLVGGYRVVNKGPVTVDLLGGGRMNFFKTTLQLDGPNRSAEGSVTKNWLDPLIAARVNAPLGGKWSFSTYGDLGGIIFGSKVTWQLAPTVSYQISRKMSLGAGWRYYKVNRDKGDFLYNVHQSGPLITFRTVL